MSKATINATPDQKLARKIGRAQNLKGWLAQAEARAGTDRAPTAEKLAAVRAEFDGIVAELSAAKAQIEALGG